MHLSPPVALALRLCSKGGGSVVVESLFIVALIIRALCALFNFSCSAYCPF